jgi:hypothetical protein
MALYDNYPVSGYNMTDLLLSEVPKAMNANSGANPDYSANDFAIAFPQFANFIASEAIPAALLTQFITMANASLSYSRYGEIWFRCMGLYVAHFCILFLRANNGGSSIAGLVAAADPVSLKTSKSVGDVSVSYDTNSIIDKLKGFGTFLTTIYGQELATYAKMAGMGGALVW